MALVIDALASAAEQLLDPGHQVHSQAQLLTAFNQAVKAVVIAQPDEGVRRTEVTCVAGSRQSIPTGGLRLIRVLGLRERTSELMFRDDPNWHSAPACGALEFWVADERNPKAFELYPNAHDGDTVVVEISQAPDDIVIDNFDSDEQPLPVNNAYLPALLEYLLYLRLSADPTNLAALQQAQAHQMQFANLMGLKWKSNQYLAEPKERGSIHG